MKSRKKKVTEAKGSAYYFRFLLQLLDSGRIPEYLRYSVEHKTEISFLIYQAMIFPVVTNRCASCSIKKTELKN